MVVEKLNISDQTASKTKGLIGKFGNKTYIENAIPKKNYYWFHLKKNSVVIR